MMSQLSLLVLGIVEFLFFLDDCSFDFMILCVEMRSLPSFSLPVDHSPVPASLNFSQLVSHHDAVWWHQT
jgi:hypothetical protein